MSSFYLPEPNRKILEPVHVEHPFLSTKKIRKKSKTLMTLLKSLSEETVSHHEAFECRRFQCHIIISLLEQVSSLNQRSVK